jgi:hypothetical protein
MEEIWGSRAPNWGHKNKRSIEWLNYYFDKGFIFIFLYLPHAP